jgi:GDP/UDP-N,N'-diacetylbacillosamine 2-epimerase (hydrolysing)
MIGISTMPNADTSGNIIRRIFLKEVGSLKNVFLIENLGTQSYFTAMKYCAFLLGNTSSGIIEAASFGKYVINLGKRQEGRATGNNVFHAGINSEELIDLVKKIEGLNTYVEGNIYEKTDSVEMILIELKKLRNS